MHRQIEYKRRRKRAPAPAAGTRSDVLPDVGKILTLVEFREREIGRRKRGRKRPIFIKFYMYKVGFRIYFLIARCINPKEFNPRKIIIF